MNPPVSSTPTEGFTPPPAPLPKTVKGLGWVSLLTDMSSEAMFPLLPIFLVSLGAGTAFVGLVEGAAELVASILKFVAGSLSDRMTKKKSWVLLGYGISTAMRPLMALAFAPWHVLLLRAFDRVGKGIRTTPRDAMILRATPSSMRARAFGFHRAMDHGGAALGTLFSMLVLYALGAHDSQPALEQLRMLFLWATIPGVLAVVAILLTPEFTNTPDLSEPKDQKTGTSAMAPLAPSSRLSTDFWRVLIPILLFGFANATDAFLIVKAMEIGMPAAQAPLLWLCLHVVKSLVGAPGGKLADRYGRRQALVLGWLVYALTWGSMGFISNVFLLFAMTACYGISHGLVEGAEKALVAERIPGGKVGRSFGIYNMGMGLVALTSSAAFGYVWQMVGCRTAFLLWGGLAFIAVGALALLVPRSTNA